MNYPRRWYHQALPRGIRRPESLRATVLAYLHACLGDARSGAQVTAWLVTLYGAHDQTGPACLRSLFRAGLVERVSRTHWRAR